MARVYTHDHSAPRRDHPAARQERIVAGQTAYTHEVPPTVPPTGSRRRSRAPGSIHRRTMASAPAVKTKPPRPCNRATTIVTMAMGHECCKLCSRRGRNIALRTSSLTRSRRPSTPSRKQRSTAAAAHPFLAWMQRTEHLSRNLALPENVLADLLGMDTRQAFEGQRPGRQSRRGRRDRGVAGGRPALPVLALRAKKCKALRR